MGTDTLTYGYAPIVKTERTPEGLMVYGKMAGPGLDLDGQRFSAEYLKKAVPDWFKWANVREQHSAIAAGVGKELTQDGDDWWLKALIVDPTTIKKVETGVLKGFSGGVKKGLIRKSAAAPNGEIYDGLWVETSLVDRPSDPTNLVTICKSAGGTTFYAVDTDGELIGEVDLVEKVLSGDLHKSLAAMGYDDAAEATADAITELCELIEEQTAIIKAAVADGEAAGVEELNKAVQALGEFVDDTPTESAEELIQKALSGDSNDAIGTLFRAEITKAVAEAKAPLEEQLKTVQADLAKALAAPRPGGPVLLTQPTPAPLNKSAEADRLSAIAASHPEPEMRLAYQAAAAKAKEVAA